MLRTGGRLTRSELAGPCARDGGGGPRAPREGITRARRRRASGVAGARAISRGGGSQPSRASPARRRPRRRGSDQAPAEIVLLHCSRAHPYARSPLSVEMSAPANGYPPAHRHGSASSDYRVEKTDRKSVV